MKWHTVRFVDETYPPHPTVMLEHWRTMRGRPVQIGPMLNRQQVQERLIGSLNGCDCEQFFYLNPDEYVPAKIVEAEPVICRRMLEMD